MERLVFGMFKWIGSSKYGFRDFIRWLKFKKLVTISWRRKFDII